MTWYSNGSPWRGRLLQFGLLLLLLVVVYWDTFHSMIQIWIRSETFAHGFLVAPVAAWLAWRNRERLLAVPPVYAPLALLPLVALGLFWLLAQLADVQVVRQLAVVLMIAALFLLVAGWSAFRVMLFPLAYLLFAVPAGEALIPPLIDFTATMTVNLIRLSGIPVYWEGNLIALPSGNWAVVEACSGVRYLIASINLGVLFAWLRYRSLSRRLLFVLASILVPILANGLRGYLIVMLGHISGMKLAVGVDHLIYGWVFFGLVMFLLFWVGNYWREDLGPAEETSGVSGASPVAHRRSPAWVAVGVVLLLAWPAWSKAIQGGRYEPPVIDLSPLVLEEGWQPMDGAPIAWEPRYLGQTARFRQWFRRGGHEVGVFVEFYGPLMEDHEMINSRNLLIAPDDFTWRKLSAGQRLVTMEGLRIPVEESLLRSASVDLLVWRSNWIAGTWVARDYLAKVLQALHALRGRIPQGATLLVVAPMGHRSEETRREMARLVRVLLPPLERRLERFHDGKGPGSRE
ncbi:MAG TPA: exosortase A [Thiotrichales bacterium]|nr:exosortase A [Thiotrichales bacterium]